jgi:glycosyltransferase involved in cell wall biosynthesis
VVLPYFTAPESAAPLDPGEPRPERPYFLFAGRLVWLKGLQTLIPVFRRYPKARLLVAGTGPDEARLRRMAGGHPNIVFVGHRSGPQLRQLYRDAVALIVPSLWYEVFGLVIIEALAQQTPAIVRNIGGMPEIIAESGGGLVYETEMDLVSAMDRLLAESSMRATLGRRGYEATQGRWSASTHLAAYLEIVDDAMTRTRG